MERLTQKVGPLPVWVYGVMVGAVIGIYVFYIRGRGGDDAPADETSAEDGGTIPVEVSGAGLDSVSSPYTSGVLPGASGNALDVNELYSINPDTGRPYIVDLNDPINPATGLPFNADYASALTREELLREIQEGQGAELERLRDRLNSEVVSAQPMPVMVENPPAPPAAPTPPPSSAPAYLPTKGPWAAEPNAATKNALGAQGYRVVRRGDGKWIAVDKRYKS